MAEYASGSGKGTTPAGYIVITTTRATPHFPDGMALEEIVDAKIMLIEETQKNWDMVVGWLINGRGEDTPDSEWNTCEPAEVKVFGHLVTPNGFQIDADGIRASAEDSLVDVWAYDYPLTVTANCDPRDAYIEAYVWMRVHGWTKVAYKGKRVPKGNGQPAPDIPEASNPQPERRVGGNPIIDTMVEAGKVAEQKVTHKFVSLPNGGEIAVRIPDPPTESQPGELEAVNCKTINCKTSKKGKTYYVAGGVTIWDTQHFGPVVEAGIPVDKLAAGMSINMANYPDYAVKVHYTVGDDGFRKFMGLEINPAFGSQPASKQPF